MSATFSDSGLGLKTQVFWDVNGESSHLAGASAVSQRQSLRGTKCLTKDLMTCESA